MSTKLKNWYTQSRLKLEISSKKISGKSPKYLEINAILMSHAVQKGYNKEIKNILSWMKWKHTRWYNRLSNASGKCIYLMLILDKRRYLKSISKVSTLRNLRIRGN